MAEFKESEHPRDKDGKFTDKGKRQGWTKEKRYRLKEVLKTRKVQAKPNQNRILGRFLEKRRARQFGADNGAFDDDAKREETEALKKYDQIRQDNTDVRKISKNARVSIKIVKKAKNHLFYEKHNLDGGYRTFDPSNDIADSWMRLISGKGIKEQDRILVLHEYLESEYMAQGMTYEEAHKEANKKYNYEKYYK